MEYAFREAALEIKVYFCPVDERMTNVEEKLSFVAEVLRGVLMGFCLFREGSWKFTVRENILYYQPWVMLGLVLECVKHCMMSAGETGRHACLKKGLALKHCFVLTYMVVLRLYECSGFYLERVFLNS